MGSPHALTMLGSQWTGLLLIVDANNARRSTVGEMREGNCKFASSVVLVLVGAGFWKVLCFPCFSPLLLTADLQTRFCPWTKQSQLRLYAS